MQLLVPNPHINRWRRHVKVDGEVGGAVHSEPDIRRSTRDSYKLRKKKHKRLELGQELNTDHCGAITGPHSCYGPTLASDLTTLVLPEFGFGPTQEP